MKKDPYTTLGLFPGVEEVVIPAAYRALAQRYHPDRFPGPKDVAEERMKEINAAYAVLSDPARRAEYDVEHPFLHVPDEMDEAAAGEMFADATHDLESAWDFAREYYPDLDVFVDKLRQYSPGLAFAYRLVLIQQRAFEQRAQICGQMEHEFVKLSFGGKGAIQRFGRDLLFAGRHEAAFELKKAISLLGPDADPDRIVEHVRMKFGLHEPPFDGAYRDA